MNDLALLGATGAIGKSIAAALQDKRFRVVGRDAGKLKSEFGTSPTAEFAVWNIDDPASIRAALHGVDTAVYLLGMPYHKFELHPLVMRRVVDAAIAEGVRRFLLIGTLYPFGRARAPCIDENHPRDPHTFKGHMRKQQEDILFAAAGKMEVAELRLPDFYGPDVANSFLQDIFVAAAAGRRANVIGPLDVPHEYVFVPDVGPVVVRLLETPGAFGRAWNLGGAGTITTRQVAEIAFGGKPKLRVAGKFLLRLMGLFNPLFREIAEMYYLMTDPLIVNDAALTRLLDGIHKTSYRDGIAQCVAAAKRKKQIR